MPKFGVTREKVVQLAIEITTEKGFDSVTLNDISERLGIKTPSLYKHISGIAELKGHVSRHAAESLKSQLVLAVMGRSGIEAIREMGRSYIKFANENTHLYETIQWLNITSDVQSGSLFAEVVNVVYNFAREFGADELEASHIIRTIRSMAQGFASISSHQGFAHESSVESSYEYALDTFILGIKAKKERG